MDSSRPWIALSISQQRRFLDLDVRRDIGDRSRSYSMFKVQEIAHKVGVTPQDMLQKLCHSGFRSTLDSSIDLSAATLPGSRREERYRGSKLTLHYAKSTRNSK